MAYCLMANKTSESYKQVFEVLKNKMGGAVVQKFRADFEKTLILEFLNI